MNRSQRDEQIKFPNYVRAIIATKGLPCTWKTTIARRIGDWARCPVLYIDHFLDALSVEKGYTADSMPSKEEGKRINRVAIEALWKAAERHLDKTYGSRCLVVKSNLSSSFELDLLARLVQKFDFSIKVIVIDCQMKNEHRYRRKMKQRVSLSSHLEWCKASSWNDIVKARDADDCLLDDDHAWDQHIQDLIKGSDNYQSKWRIDFRFIRLVVDAYEDINLYQNYITEIGSDFRDPIRYLMDKSTYEGFVKDDNARYQVMQFRELRRVLVEMNLQMPRDEFTYACNICKFYCHVKCIFHDQAEILHEHGGYKHVMKLMFSHDGMEPEESYWCDKCYEDLDPQNWFYICTRCPYYVTHTQCPRRIRKAATRAVRTGINALSYITSDSDSN